MRRAGLMARPGFTGAGAGGALVRAVFFFQAEDGIRDVAVTGVQTCALPISVRDGATSVEKVTRTVSPGGSRTRRRKLTIGSSTAPVVLERGWPSITAAGEIGRASCRERV